jgi:Domain of unknown function (DUF1844)
VSSLWTPEGERPVGRSTDPPPPDSEPPASDEEVAAQVEAMRAELIEAPVEIVVANHCYGLFELAAVYLSQQPPLLPQARLAIDALGVLVDGLTGRLGDAESSLRDGLAQLRLAYVQIDGAQQTAEAAASAVGTNGDSGATSRAEADADADGPATGADTQATEQTTDG